MMSKIICSVVNIITNANDVQFLYMENLSDDIDLVVIHYSLNINDKLEKFKLYISKIFDDYVLFTKDQSDKHICIYAIHKNDVNDANIVSKTLCLIDEIANKVEE